MKNDIFISYSRKDSAIVDKFISAFEDAGYTVWYDKDGIESSDDFKHKIVSAIEESAVFIFFSSLNSNQSPWTAKEIGIANSRKKHIIPIKLDYSDYNKSVEFDLINVDFVDYVNEKTRLQNIQKLNDSLQNIIGSSNRGLVNVLNFSFNKPTTETKFGNKHILAIIGASILSLVLLVIEPILIYVLGIILLAYFLWRGKKQAFIWVGSYLLIITLIFLLIGIYDDSSSINDTDAIETSEQVDQEYVEDEPYGSDEYEQYIEGSVSDAIYDYINSL